MKLMAVQPPGEIVGRHNADVKVVCCMCGRMGYWRSMLIDVHGTPFKSYYHEACAPNPNNGKEE